MNNIIYKYPLHFVTRQQLHLPIGAKILSVRVQRESLVLWAEVEQGAKGTMRTIEVNPTGMDLPKLNPDQERVHLGTTQPGDALVWHVFEIIQKQI